MSRKRKTEKPTAGTVEAVVERKAPPRSSGKQKQFAPIESEPLPAISTLEPSHVVDRGIEPIPVAAELPMALTPLPVDQDVTAAEPDEGSIASNAPLDSSHPVAPEFAESVVTAAATPVTESRMHIQVRDDARSIGQRLRAARDARSWSREDVAHRLHVPTTVIADIEAERFDRLGAPVYVRGYLSKYADLVGLPQVVVTRALQNVVEPDLLAAVETPVVATGFERHRIAIIGAIVTLAVIVPVASLVSNRGVLAPVPQVRSLDVSELEPGRGSVVELQPRPPIESPEPAPPATEVGGALASAAIDAPIMIEPSPPLDRSTQSMASMTPVLAPAAGHALDVRFIEDSWFEIYDASGRSLEQNLIRAGETRRYESTGVLNLKIGNVGGVELRADGNPIDLGSHARANVARLRLFEEGSSAQ